VSQVLTCLSILLRAGTKKDKGRITAGKQPGDNRNAARGRKENQCYVNLIDGFHCELIKKRQQQLHKNKTHSNGNDNNQHGFTQELSDQ
jgi:hypothetical protein